ncbi:glycosyltransferase [Brucella intermedia]|uniref:glycosyltransferase n=1 Tax=Brucella intermedia TaxID=94625 RepID=UPI00209A9E6F|nr:glycosyltransferase [Brucella intermedia]MCO7728840.1 glycosyltransferase [Brucella intermedia]WLF97144.1 glycosyltransferase [Brucella intermedia]
MSLSVLVSIYRLERPNYLERSLKSIWSDQQLKPDEIVLVLDGPITHQLQTVVSRWKKQIGESLRIVPLGENIGLGGALRAGLNACSCEFVARMDADDIALDTRFQKQVEYLSSNPDIAVLGSCAFLINAEGEQIGERTVPVTDTEIKRLIWTCPMIHPSVMFRRLRILEAGSYDADIPSRQEDYDLWIRAARHGLKFHNLPESLIFYRVSGEEKNDWRVGWNRLKIGWSAAQEFDPRLLSYLGVFYPLIRSLLPRYLRNRLIKLIRFCDPR